MDWLPVELQELILEKVDSKTLYNFIRSEPNEIITNVLERRTRNIIHRLEVELKKNDSSVIGVDCYGVPDEYKQHMKILLSVICLPNMHPLVDESIEHLVARYSTPENYKSIDDNIHYLIDQTFDYNYGDYSMFSIRKAEKYYKRMCYTIANSGNYNTFEQEFYFLCNILSEYYGRDYSQLSHLYYNEQEFAGFYNDLWNILSIASEFINNHTVINMFSTLITELTR